MNGVNGHASPAPAMSAAVWDRAIAYASRRGAEHFIGITLRCGVLLRDATTRWRAITTDGRELSTYDRKASAAYRRLRAIAPLVPGMFAECGRADFASRAQITEERKAPGA